MRQPGVRAIRIGESIYALIALLLWLGLPRGVGSTTVLVFGIAPIAWLAQLLVAVGLHRSRALRSRGAAGDQTAGTLAADRTS